MEKKINIYDLYKNSETCNDKKIRGFCDFAQEKCIEISGGKYKPLSVEIRFAEYGYAMKFFSKAVILIKKERKIYEMYYFEVATLIARLMLKEKPEVSAINWKMDILRINISYHICEIYGLKEFVDMMKTSFYSENIIDLRDYFTTKNDLHILKDGKFPLSLYSKLIYKLSYSDINDIIDKKYENFSDFLSDKKINSNSLNIII
jgi:hypothetical protein